MAIFDIYQRLKSGADPKGEVAALAGLEGEARANLTDALFIVDAITGLGTMPVKIDEWGIDIVVGGSQKSFMIPPGLASLSVSVRAWPRMETT